MHLVPGLAQCPPQADPSGWHLNEQKKSSFFITRAITLLTPEPITCHKPFERIGVDVVGPLERSQSGNRFILVICDYATRYPEAYPLKEITAKQVAIALLRLFSQVGIPKEFLTDQGPNFMRHTFHQVYELFEIKRVRSIPYHPQTDGLVERFNKTLKNMLKMFVSETGNDWDKWLPYLLFAYWDFLLLNSCTLTQSEVLLMF